jgi:protein-S-isoprenylcysteine O-methyltransferase Ste14
MIWLLFRNLFFTLLQPGTVGVLGPWLLLRGTGRTLFPDTWTWSHLIGLALVSIGLVVLMICIWRFPAEGKGTISPLDPTRQLVSGGLYKYSRNPMYLGMIILLAGEAVYFRSWTLAVYTAVAALGFHLFILFHEEPRLRRAFGPQYADYSTRVRRWL